MIGKALYFFAFNNRKDKQSFQRIVFFRKIDNGISFKKEKQVLR